MNDQPSKGFSLPTREAMQRVVRQSPGQVSMVAMALVGIGISVYLTSVHYEKVPLLCSTTGLIDCASVLASPYSLIPGTTLPITFAGMAWFIVSGGMALTVLVRQVRNDAVPERLFQGQKIWGGIGLVSILYLVYAEIVQLHRLCAWCTVVHGLVLATFLVALAHEPVASTPSKSVPARAAVHQINKPASKQSSSVKAHAAINQQNAAKHRAATRHK